MPYQALNDDSIRKQIHHLLRSWHKPENQTGFGNDGQLFSYREYSEVRKLMIDCLEALAVEDQQGAHILRQRFLHRNTILAVARQLNLSPDQLNRRQREAIMKLAEIVIERETMIRESRSVYLTSHLQAPSYTRLVGSEEKVDTLKAILTQEDAPWTISVTGIGGIGKTALADAVIRQVLDLMVFKDIIWLRAPFCEEEGQPNADAAVDLGAKMAEALLPPETPTDERQVLLLKVLKNQPHLIVVDNLHTQAEFETVVAQLSGYLNPSKALLTSRFRPTSNGETYTFNLDELSYEDSRELLAHHAHQIGLGEQVTTLLSQSQSIYQVVGGNPLALKLLIGLLVTLPLTVVLLDFTQASLNDIERMYRFIYLKAWHALDESAQRLLVGMVQASDYGVTFENIQAFSQLPGNLLAAALQALYNRSLLEPRGTIEERRYGIHRLTLSFLQTDIVPWPPQH